MGVEVAVGGAIIGGIAGNIQSNNRRQAEKSYLRKQRRQFDSYLKDFDSRINKRKDELYTRLDDSQRLANQHLTSNVATLSAQSARGAGARASQSGIGGANVEALIAESQAPILQQEAMARQGMEESRRAGEANILDFVASTEDQRAQMVYNFNTNYDAQEAQSAAAHANKFNEILSTGLGFATTALNIYSGVQSAQLGEAMLANMGKTNTEQVAAGTYTLPTANNPVTGAPDYVSKKYSSTGPSTTTPYIGTWNDQNKDLFGFMNELLYNSPVVSTIYKRGK